MRALKTMRPPSPACCRSPGIDEISPFEGRVVGRSTVGGCPVRDGWRILQCLRVPTLFLPALLLSCGVSDSGGTPTAPPTPASMSIVPASVTLAALGETVQLTATVLDHGGQPVQGLTLAWTSSDGSVATVDAGGVVTAVWNGSTTIWAAVQGGGASGNVSVIVAQQAWEIRVSPEQRSFSELGDTLRLSARGFDANGNAVEGAEFRWSSSDETVVTVDSTGLITVVGNGTASVTASSGPATASASFMVTQRAAELQLSPRFDTLRALGDTLRMQVSGIDANGHPVHDVGEELKWSSDDQSIATVDTDGLVTAVGNGSASITAASAHASGSTAVTIAQRTTEIRVLPPDEVLRAVGATTQLVAEAFDANGHPVAQVAFSWESADEAVVTVDGTGLVTAVDNGSTSVVASSEPGAVGSVVVEVSQEAVAIQVSPDADTLRWLGDTLRLSAEAFDANEYLVGDAEFTWSSSDESVATVDGGGLVTGEGVGTVDITATVNDADITDTAALWVETLPARDVLIALYDATNGPNWENNENWLTDAPLGEWHGVRTDYRDETIVTAIVLHDNGLNGRLPAHLGNLESLAQLYLQYNELSGPIPAELGSLANLKILNLWHNNLTGSIPPELARLTGLSELWLANNELTGPIPPELGAMAGLRELMLESNRLSGAIPAELAGMTAVEGLRLGANELTGSIPPELGDLPVVRTLSLWGNQLSGAIPLELGSLASLTYLALGQNNLEGAIPAELGNLRNLQVILFGKNKLSGSIPPELGDLGSLRTLALMENELTGSVPFEIGGLTSLEELYIQDNQGLAGPIPQDFVSLTLDEFWWYRTQLCAPPNPAFQAWLLTVGQNLGTGTCTTGGS